MKVATVRRPMGRLALRTQQKKEKVSAASEIAARVAKAGVPVKTTPLGVLANGDNLPILNELAAHAKGKFRCVYLDPPYNNQEKYRHYDDVSSHEEWLAMIRERLDAIKPLLAIDGSVWISIDDREVHYLKTMADEVFGRANFVTTVIWQQRTTRENRKVFSASHEYILVYAANPDSFRTARNLLPATDEQLSRYKNPDNDVRGAWQSVSANVQDGHATQSQYYALRAPNGRVHRPPNGRCWVFTEARMKAEIAAGNVWFGKDGNGTPRLKRFMKGRKIGLTPDTLWLGADVGTSDEAKKEVLRLFPGQPVFDTPKPERLLKRILEIATNPEDLVLDPFLGSGTTAAVAHQMNRRYVGIEQSAVTFALAAKRIQTLNDSKGVESPSRTS